MAVSDDLAIALLITVDQGVRFAEQAGRELADQLAPLGVEVIASVATMGIPVAIEVVRARSESTTTWCSRRPRRSISSTPSPSRSDRSRPAGLSNSARPESDRRHRRSERRVDRRRHLDGSVRARRASPSCGAPARYPHRRRGPRDRRSGLAGHSRTRRGSRPLPRFPSALRPRRERRTVRDPLAEPTRAAHRGSARPTNRPRAPDGEGPRAR